MRILWSRDSSNYIGEHLELVGQVWLGLTANSLLSLIFPTVILVKKQFKTVKLQIQILILDKKIKNFDCYSWSVQQYCFLWRWHTCVLIGVVLSTTLAGFSITIIIVGHITVSLFEVIENKILLVIKHVSEWFASNLLTLIF